MRILWWIFVVCLMVVSGTAIACFVSRERESPAVIGRNTVDLTDISSLEPQAEAVKYDSAEEAWRSLTEALREQRDVDVIRLAEDIREHWPGTRECAEAMFERVQALERGARYERLVDAYVDSCRAYADFTLTQARASGLHLSKEASDRTYRATFESRLRQRIEHFSTLTRDLDPWLALLYLDGLSERFPEYPYFSEENIRLKRAEIAMQMGRREEAETLARSLLSEFPDNTFAEALVRAVTRDKDEKLRLEIKAAERKTEPGEKADGYHNAAMLAMHCGPEYWPQATRLLRQCIALEPESLRAQVAREQIARIHGWVITASKEKR